MLVIYKDSTTMEILETKFVILKKGIMVIYKGSTARLLNLMSNGQNWDENQTTMSFLNCKDKSCDINKPH